MKPLLLGVFSFFLPSSLLFSQPETRGLIGRNSPDSARSSYALVIGISQYAYVHKLEYADDDAELFADYLVKEKLCDRKNIRELTDSLATRVNILGEMKLLGQKLKPHDRVFIYFAGHGDVESDLEQGYLLPYDCLANNYSATGIEIRKVEDFINYYVNKEVKVILITDACRSGNLTGGLSGVSATLSTLAKGFKNVIKLVSCQPNQLSQEKLYPEGGHGIFTYHLVDGLSGMADKDDNGYISLWEIDRYLEKVRIETDKKQTPEVEGDKEANIVGFDRTLLQSLLLSKKTNPDGAILALNRSRGPEDSVWLNNRYYQQFREYLRKQVYNGPGAANALSVIKTAEKSMQPPEMISYMKLELSIDLEDAAQKWINKYLRGNLGNNNELELAELKKLSAYAGIIESLNGMNDLLYEDIHIKKIFFDAYYIYRSRNRAVFEKTLGELEKIISLAPNRAWIHNLCGSFYRTLGRHPESEAAYRLALRISPTWAYPWLGLAVLYQNMQKPDKADDAFKNAVTINPDFAVAWNEWGKFYYRRGKYAEAENAYLNGIRADSVHFADSWLDLGNLYFDLKRLDEAEKAFYRSIAIRPEFEYPWNSLGNLYILQKKFDRSEQCFNQAIRINPGYADAYYNLGALQKMKGDTRKALANLELAFKNGFNAFDELEQDPYWSSLRETEAFKALVKKYRK